MRSWGGDRSHHGRGSSGDQIESGTALGLNPGYEECGCSDWNRRNRPVLGGSHRWGSPQSQARLAVIDLLGCRRINCSSRSRRFLPLTRRLLPGDPEDGSVQPVTGTYEMVSAIAQRFPTYCFINRCLGHGVVDE